MKLHAHFTHAASISFLQYKEQWYYFNTTARQTAAFWGATETRDTSDVKDTRNNAETRNIRVIVQTQLMALNFVYCLCVIAKDLSLMVWYCVLVPVPLLHSVPVPVPISPVTTLLLIQHSNYVFIFALTQVVSLLTQN